MQSIRSVYSQPRLGYYLPSRNNLINIKTEFWLSNFSFYYPNATRFIKCQWHYEWDVSITYMVYRWIFAIVFTAGVLFGLLDSANRGKYFWTLLFYTSSWISVMCMLEGILVATMVTMFFIGMVARSRKILMMAVRPYKIYWLLNVLATDCVIVFTIRFWTYRYYAAKLDKERGPVINLFHNLLSPFLIFIDFWLVSHPVQMYHAAYPVIFFFVHEFFIAAWYHIVGPESVQGYYPSIARWEEKNKLAALEILGLRIAVAIIVHLVFLILQKIRRELHYRCWKYCGDPFITYHRESYEPEDDFILNTRTSISHTLAEMNQQQSPLGRPSRGRV